MKIALTGNSIPDEAIQTAQIAFCSAETWSIIAGRRRLSGVLSIMPMPVVGCPVVNTRGIHDDQKMAEILRRHITPYGVADAPALVADLEAIGGSAYMMIDPEAVVVGVLSSSCLHDISTVEVAA